MAGKKKTLRLSCPLAEETKGRKPSAVPLFFAPAIGDALIRDTIISLHNNGRTRLHLLIVQRSRCSASSAGLYALCLAPPGTSLKGHSCLLLCVFTFDCLMITPEFAARQDAHLPKNESGAEKVSVISPTGFLRCAKTRRARSGHGVSLSKPRRVSPPVRRKKVQSFSQATCAAEKILLGLQTCAPSASGGQRVRCSQAANPFVKKAMLF